MILRTGNSTGHYRQACGLWSLVYSLRSGFYGLNKGATFFEALLTVVVLSVGLVGVLRVYAASLSILEEVGDTMGGLVLTQEKMADIEQTALEEGGISIGISSGQFNKRLGDYVWESNATALSTAGLDALTLTVYHAGRSRRFQLATYIEDKNDELP